MNQMIHSFIQVHPLGLKVFGSHFPWKRQTGTGNCPAKKIPSFLSYHRVPECPPGDLNIISPSLQSVGIKLVL